jgi:hypothetical protein
MGSTYYCECRDGLENPQAFKDGDIVLTLTLDIPDDIKAGEYEIGLDRFHVVEQGSQQGGEIVEFDAKIVPGKVVIKGEGTSENPSDPTEDDKPDVKSDFVVTGSTLEYNLGDEYKDAYLDFTVESGGHLGSTLAAEVAELPAGITYKITEKNLAIPGKPAWSLMGSTYYCECRDGLENPQAFKDGDIVLTLTLTIPSDIKAGEYEIDLDRFHVVEQGSQQGGEIVEFDAKVVPGKVVIKGEDKVTTTTAPKPDDNVTTTTTTPVPTDVLYGDSNCDGKVNIADVVVLNKWLNDNSAYNLTAQGKINADCCDAKAGTPDENDSKAIIQSLVSLVTLDCKSADLK